MPLDASAHALAVLRTALEALALGDDAPDLVRLSSTLQGLALAGDAIEAPSWDPVTGMPAPEWLESLSELASASLAEDDPSDDLPDRGMVNATRLDPELGARLITRRTLIRFLRRNGLFPTPPAVRVSADGPWWCCDVVLQDGRWGRVRVKGDQHRVLPKESLAFGLTIDDLSAEFAYEDVRRTVLGPAALDATGAVVGLWVTVERLGDGELRRLLIDRMFAEDVDAKGATVVPLAVLSRD